MYSTIFSRRSNTICKTPKIIWEIINPFKIKVAPLIKKNGKKRKTIFLGTEKRLSFVIVQSYLESGRSSQNDHSNNKLGSNLLSRIWRLKKVQKKITCILAAFYRVKYIASTKVSWEVFEQASINFDLGSTLSFGNTSIQMPQKRQFMTRVRLFVKQM